MKGGALVLLMQLLVVMILSFPCANAHMSVDIAGEEAAHQRLLWLTSTAQSISGQMEHLLGGDGEGISSLATLRGVGEWMYSSLWSRVGVKAGAASASAQLSSENTQERHSMHQPFISSDLQSPLFSLVTVVGMESQTQFLCYSGIFAVLNGATFDCPGYEAVSAQQFVAMSPEQRMGCTRVGGQSSTYSPESWGQMCVCTPDYVQAMEVDIVYCIPRPLSVTVEIDPQYRCRREEDLGAAGVSTYYPNEYCVVAERDGVVHLNVKLRSSWMSDDAIRNVDMHRLVVLTSPLSTSDTLWVTSSGSATYDYIARQKMWYVVDPSLVGNGYSFCVSGWNALFNNMDKFSTIFSFTEPEVMDSTTQVTAVGNPRSNLFSILFGGRDGTAATGEYTVTYDLSSVPDPCLESGEMYMETGLRGGQRFLMGYAVARIHISFPSLSKPSDKTFSYKVGLSSAYIFLIVCACLIVMGAAVSVGRRLCQHCQRERFQPKSKASAEPFFG